MMQGVFNRVTDYQYYDFSEEFEAPFSEYDNSNVVSSDSYDDFDVFDYEQEFQLNDINSDESQIHKDLNVNSEIITRAADIESAALVKNAEEKAAQIMADAMEAAERLKRESEIEAEKMKNEAHQTAYNSGLEEGRKEGYEQAFAEGKAELEEKNRQLLEEVSRTIAELDRLKTEYIRQYQDDMTDMVLSVAEKVINVSLKSSSEIIRRMIANVIEDSREKKWAKIYISEYDANLMVREDTDILDVLKNVSDSVKIVVMENGKPGDLLVEYPNSAADFGVTTQMDNIRKIVANAE